MNAGLSYTMTCATGSFRKEAHAFTDEWYRFRSSGARSGRGLAARGAAAGGCGVEVHGAGVVADRDAGRRADGLAVCSLPRPDGRPQRRRRADGAREVSAEAAADARSVAGAGAGRPAAAEGTVCTGPR